MAEFLKKLQSENFRLRFLKFSEIDSLGGLENHTRIKSFILYDKFEISCTKWYLMYRSIVDCLQSLKPLPLEHLLDVSPFYGRCRPFLDLYSDGYSKTDFGLYVRNPGKANDTITYIRRLLMVYGFNLNDAYLVVELTPDAARYDSDDIIEEAKQNLYDFLKRTYVNAEEYYQVAVSAIYELNHSLQYFSTTTYNNLYLLNELDFRKYSTFACEKQLKRENNRFSDRELNLAISWLSLSRFYYGDYLNIKSISEGDNFIIDSNRVIKVTFATRYVKDVQHE